MAQLVPWYLFPGTSQPVEPVDTAKQEAIVKPSEPIKSDEVRICLTMPFNATGQTPNRWAFDFYCGVLMAYDDLEREGAKITLDVFDSEDSLGKRVPTCDPFRYDIILGPVSGEEISDLCAICPEWQPVISPLDGSVSASTIGHNIIQVPTSHDSQTQDLVNWALEDYNPLLDTIIVIKNESEAFTDALRSRGIQFIQATPATPLDSLCSRLGTTRFLIDSDSEPVVSNEIRRVSVLSMMRYNVVLYCHSKARSYENLSVELLHTCSAHISSTYNIDYADPEIINFVKSYRNRFNCEPNQFAFHGYDCVQFFTKARMQFGSDWAARLHELEFKGLQADFRFSGNRNLAARRLIYNPDFSITCQK